MHHPERHRAFTQIWSGSDYRGQRYVPGILCAQAVLADPQEPLPMVGSRARYRLVPRAALWKLKSRETATREIKHVPSCSACEVHPRTVFVATGKPRNCCFCPSVIRRGSRTQPVFSCWNHRLCGINEDSVQKAARLA